MAVSVRSIAFEPPDESAARVSAAGLSAPRRDARRAARRSGPHSVPAAASPLQPQGREEALPEAQSPTPPAGEADAVQASEELRADLVATAYDGVRPATPRSAQPALRPTAMAPTETVPVYPTRLPPAFSFVYDLQRGLISGRGELALQRTPGGYEARLEGSVAGIGLMDWKSVGTFDEAGFAPGRFTDQRRGRPAQAANFQRGAGKITYSGPKVEVPLPPGAQDRLSWMLQLAAIAQARPERLVPGERIALFVSGSRGDADVWTFKVAARETVPTALGRVSAVRLLREPRKPYDTRAEIWLDPARSHLPVKARLSTNPDGSEALELTLLQAAPLRP